MSELLTQEMNRREFLLYLGIILLTITGIIGMDKNLSGLVNKKQTNGFGGGPYGK
jgi:hypothetical protein